jgi:hypothetical protein
MTRWDSGRISVLRPRRSGLGTRVIAALVVALLGAWCVASSARADAAGADADLRLTSALNQVVDLPQVEAEKLALQADHPAALELGDTNSRGLLRAVAFERAGKRDAALQAYAVIRGGKSAAHAASAGVRSDVLAARSGGKEKLEEVYERLLERADTPGWFQEGNRWTWSSTRHAALTSLVELRKNTISYVFFDALRARSLLSSGYGYLFVLAAIAFSLQILSLPLQIRGVKLAGALYRLRHEIEAIKRETQGDASALGMRMQELYRRHGVNPWSGCLTAAVNFSFMVILYVTISDYAPRLVLDQSRFLFVSDVTTPNVGLTLGCLSLATLLGRISPYSRSQSTFGQALGGTLFVAAIGWYFEWPAYVFVFMLVLTVIATSFETILRVGFSVGES